MEEIHSEPVKHDTLKEVAGGECRSEVKKSNEKKVLDETHPEAFFQPVYGEQQKSKN